MARLTNQHIWEMMALSKFQFHNEEKWNEITLWSTFYWSDVSRLLQNGKLKTSMKKENKILWVRPTCGTYLSYIEPIVKKYESGELKIPSF